MPMTELAHAIGDLRVPVSPSGLTDAIAVQDMLDARIAVAVGAFDALGLADEDGALSTQSWLRNRAKMDHKSAGRLVGLGRRLHLFTRLREAALDGRLSGGQLAIVTACVPERHFVLFAEHEEVIVADLEQLGIDGTKVLMQSWLAKADALDEASQRKEKPNEAFLGKTLDGRGELRSSMDADRTATAEAALRIADPRDFDLTMPQRRAEALDTIFNFYLDHHEDRSGGRRHRPHLNVTMTYAELVNGLGGTYSDTGGRVSATESAVLRCDSFLHRLLVDSEGAILDYGRATREWPADVFNAILARDGGCRFPGCDAPASHCDVHHVREWDAHHGETSLWNGAMLCRRHHRHDGTNSQTPPRRHLRAHPHRRPLRILETARPDLPPPLGRATRTTNRRQLSLSPTPTQNPEHGAPLAPLRRARPRKRARLLLCTDGLSNEVPDDVIRTLADAEHDVSAAADAVLDHALASGGRDNITVIVADIRPGP